MGNKIQYSYKAGAVWKKDLVFIAADDENLVAQDIPHTKILQWKNGNWGEFHVNWPCTSMCAIDEGGLKLFSMGLAGTIHVAQSSGFSEELVDVSKEGPEYRGILREIRQIDGNIYVVGMARQVYKRNGVNNWVRIDSTIRVARGTLAGLNSIDGFHKKEIYATGFDGDIWLYDGNGWRQIESPTNLALNRIVCSKDGVVYVCGQGGVLLEGRQDTWNIVENNATDSDFWGMEWFEGKLYIASSVGIYSYKNGLISSIDVGAKQPITSGSLHSGDGVLWSVGKRDLFYTDGARWFEVKVR